MKSRFAISSARRSRSCTWNRRKISRDVSSTMSARTNSNAVAIHNRNMATATEEYARPAQPPDTSSLAEVREASRTCTACHLYKRATQTVFGEGHKGATMMLVGEQPGDY